MRRLPDESKISRFQHLLEKPALDEPILATINVLWHHYGLMLKTGTMMDATLISEPNSTKNDSSERDPGMHQTKKTNTRHFGMKARIGMDAESGLVHTVICTAANVNDVMQGHALLHGKEQGAFGNSGYRGVMKRPEATGVKSTVAMRPGERGASDKMRRSRQLFDKLKQLKASIRAKVKHLFRMIKRQFEFTKVRYRTLVKNAAQIRKFFALSNPWIVRRQLTVMMG